MDCIDYSFYSDNDGAAKCQKKFMTCAGGVLVNGGLQHMNQPDGISG